MLKQAYRFVSILMLSNLLITQAGFAEMQQNPANSVAPTAVCQCKQEHKRTFFQKLFGLNKHAEQKPDGQTVPQKPVVQNPQGYNDNPAGITKYGVIFPDDFYGTYK
jgi:hypothetical protein